MPIQATLELPEYTVCVSGLFEWFLVTTCYLAAHVMYRYDQEMCRRAVDRSYCTVSHKGTGG
jgi:hypothetical protein